jgi:long-subunit fatty acid transport protein
MSEKSIYRIIIAFLVTGFCSVQNLQCQSLGKPAAGYKNTFGAATSTGFFLNKDAYFWGLGVDYSRMLNERWVFNVSMGYDQEISNKGTEGNSIVNTLTPSLAFGYIFMPKFVLGLGVGKGLFDDGNESGKLEFNKNGDWTIGLIGVYTIYQKGQHAFDISGGPEQGIGSPDFDLTVELGYGYSF